MDNVAEDLQRWDKMNEQFNAHAKKLHQDMVAIILGTYVPPVITEEQKTIDRCKLALMHSGDIIYIDNETMIGYKSIDDNFQNGLKLPLEVLSYSDFSRWCRGFDI